MTYLLVDTCSTGHHLTYIMSIARAGAKDSKVIILMPRIEDTSMIEGQENILYTVIEKGKYGSL